MIEFAEDLVTAATGGFESGPVEDFDFAAGVLDEPAFLQTACDDGDGGSLGFLGRFTEPRKGFPLLRTAFITLAESRPRLRLLVAGPGDRDELYDEFPKELHDRVVFLGLVSEADKARLLLKHYPSQTMHDWFDEESFLGLSRLRGVQCRARHAEAFVMEKATVSFGGA